MIIKKIDKKEEDEERTPNCKLFGEEKSREDNNLRVSSVEQIEKGEEKRRKENEPRQDSTLNEHKGNTEVEQALEEQSENNSDNKDRNSEIETKERANEESRNNRMSIFSVEISNGEKTHDEHEDLFKEENEKPAWEPATVKPGEKEKRKVKKYQKTIFDKDSDDE